MTVRNNIKCLWFDDLMVLMALFMIWWYCNVDKCWWWYSNGGNVRNDIMVFIYVRNDIKCWWWYYGADWNVYDMMVF